MLTTSVAVQAQRPTNTNSIGPAAELRTRSESTTMACPLLALATKRSPSIQLILASTTRLTLPAKQNVDTVPAKSSISISASFALDHARRKRAMEGQPQHCLDCKVRKRPHISA